MSADEILLNELKFKAIRSSGSGGQHVNKVATKVELSFNLWASSALSYEQKQLVFSKLQHRLTKDGILILQIDETRSQLRNKELAKKRFLGLIKEALFIHKKRIPTRIPRSVIKKRLNNKRRQSEKKLNRRKPKID